MMRRAVKILLAVALAVALLFACGTAITIWEILA